ncbi:MAG: VPLPA-CTERM-specific exosortase XrtD [Thermodesulfobacteriota bacterium]
MEKLHAVAISQVLRCISPEFYIRVIVYIALMIAIYYSSLAVMIEQWGMKEDYSYCYLIPFVVLYLVYDKRDDLTHSQFYSSWPGVFVFMAGIVIFWVGELGGEFFTIYISFWLAILGLSWMHIGWANIRKLFFPFLIMLTMFPLPNFLYQKILVRLKLISSLIGVKLMQAYGLSAYREGNIIDLGFTKLQVVDACSGLRYVIPLFVLGILVTYFYRSQFWKKIIIVFSTIPLSIATNSLRIAMTGILYELWGAQVAEGFFHGFSGWLIFMVSLGVLVGEIWILGKVFPEKDIKELDNKYKTGKEEQSSECKEEFKEKLKTPKALLSLIKNPQSVIAVLLMCATILIHQNVDFRERVPIRKSFDQFPLVIGEWTGTNQKMEENILQALHLSEYILVDYQRNDGKSINFYAAYYESQRKAESIHSPETCLPSSGWIFQQAGKVELTGTGEMETKIINRAIMQQFDIQQLVYFWFSMRGRILTNAYQMKLYNFWDALTRQRTDGAMIRLITPIYDGESNIEAEERLTKFTKDVIPILSQYLPD